GNWVFEIVNRLDLHGEPVSIDTLTLPEPLFPGLTQKMVAERPSTLYRFYQDSFGINVIGTDEHARATLASDEHAGMLNIAPGSALLELRRVAFSFNHQPVEWRVSRVNTERYEYVGQAHNRS